MPRFLFFFKIWQTVLPLEVRIKAHMPDAKQLHILNSSCTTYVNTKSQSSTARCQKDMNNNIINNNIKKKSTLEIKASEVQIVSE